MDEANRREELLEPILKEISEATRAIPRLCNFGPAGSKTYVSDLFVFGVASRTMALSSAYIGMVQQQNYLTAAALVRLQLDSAMRLFGSSLVANFPAFCKAVIDGERISKMKDRKGKLLTDRYLAQALKEIFPAAESVYDATSGFVHLSGTHIFGLVMNSDDDTGVMEMFIGATSPAASDQLWEESAAGFSHITRIIVGLIEAYRNSMSKRR